MASENLLIATMIVETTAIIVGATHLYIHFKHNKFSNEPPKKSKHHTVFTKYILPGILIICIFFLAMQLKGLESYGLIVKNRHELLRGVVVTFQVSILAIFFGTILGVLASLFLTRKKNNQFLTLFDSAITAFVYILLSVPALVLLFISHYSGIIDSVFWASVIALSINLFPFVTKIVTASINNISQEQIDAATAFGYNNRQITSYFKISFVVRSSLQSLLVEYYTTIKLSSLAGYIGLIETFHVSQDIIKDTQDPISGYIILSICYFILVAPIAVYADYREFKWKNAIK
jgi:ABC-type amino acid transport system permease subunit